MNKKEKITKWVNYVLGYSLPKLTEQEREWKRELDSKKNTNVPESFIPKYNEYKEWVTFFNLKYDNKL